MAINASERALSGLERSILHVHKTNNSNEELGIIRAEKDTHRPHAG